MDTLDLVGIQGARVDASEPFTFVDSTLPPMRGWWAGESEQGIFHGHAGLFNLNLLRAKEGYIEWPRKYRRERRWFRYVRDEVGRGGFVLWMTDHRTPPTRLVCRWADAQVLTVNNDYGGSGVLNVQSEGLLNDTLYNLETGFTVR
jgi:hypothetical protein